jgi:hypothetical protein
MGKLPQALIDLTRPARRLVATSIYSAPAPKFDHRVAQRYELEHARVWIREHHQRMTDAVAQAKRSGGHWVNADSQWFAGDEIAWAAWVEHVKGRSVLEIGSGPYGQISPCSWMTKRTVIDPLAESYRSIQMSMNGETFFPDEIEVISAPAETQIAHLVGKVDGAIFCRNALDHCEDPFSVLGNISAYAAPGCELFLWTDIWHLNGPDAGHRNITKSETFMDTAISALGFKLVRRLKNIRPPNECLEYGCVARKLP